MVETLRQLGIYLPLRYFGVAPTAHLLIGDLYFALAPDREPRVGHGGTEVTCAIAVRKVRRDADGAVTGLRLDVRYACAGTDFARAAAAPASSTRTATAPYGTGTTTTPSARTRLGSRLPAGLPTRPRTRPRTGPRTGPRAPLRTAAPSLPRSRSPGTATW